MEKAALFWSGGKDAAFALYRIQEAQQFSVEFLVTTLTQEYRRVSMHGIREELLRRQAKAVNIPLYEMWVPAIADNSRYEKVLNETFIQLKEKDITSVIFGDIFLEDLRVYRELLAKDAGLNISFPLWGQDTGSMIREFLDIGFKTVTCAISTKFLSKDFLGKEIDEVFINKLPDDADPCGENGEYHTFCFDGPIFSRPVMFELGEEKYKPLKIRTSENVQEQGFWFVDLVPKG